MRSIGKPTWSDTYLSASSGQLEVAYAIPVGPNTLTGEIELERLSKFIERISTKDQLEIMIVDGIGALVAHPRTELTGQQLNLSNLPIVASGLRGNTGFEEFEYRGQDLVGVAIPVQQLGWVALVAQPYRIAYKSVAVATNLVIAALVLGLMLSAGGGVMLANWVANRIDYFADNARQIAGGVYNLEWPTSKLAEFSALGQHLRSMASAIQLREKELKEQQLRFQTAFETSPLAMSIVQADNGMIVEVNQGWADMLGYSVNDVIGQSVDELEIWIDGQEGKAYRDKVLRSGLIREYESKLKRTSGETAVVQLNSARIAYHGIDFVMSIIVDVTERNRLDKQLRDTELLQAAILSSAGHSIISTTPEGTITTFNKTAEKMLGYAAGEMIGKKTPAVFHDPQEIRSRAAEFSEKLGRVVEPGFDVFVVHSSLGMDNEYEWTYVRKDGSRFPVLLNVTALQDDTGSVSGYLGIAIDISQRKAAEASLKESERRLTRQKLAIVELARTQRNEARNLEDLLRVVSELLANAVEVQRASIWSYEEDSDSIVCLNLYEQSAHRHSQGARIRRVDNPAYFQALESQRVIVASDPQMDPATRDFNEGYLKPLGIKALLDATILRGNKVIGVVCFEHIDGIRQWTIDEQNFATAMADFISLSIELDHHQRTSEELQQYKEHLEDLVAVRTRQLESVNAELNAFAYSVSHDLRAPLRGIDGFSQALLEDHGEHLDEEGKNYLERVRNATQRMGGLIDDLLKLSKINRAEIDRQSVDLSNISREVVEELATTFPDRNIEISIEPGLVADGDPGLLKIVMENLIGNAWKYTGKTVSPGIHIGADRKDGATVYYIRDNGAGFDMAYAGKLFGAFQRFHRDTEFPGTGIGLATVSRIINRHGGRIWADAKPNEGAVFYFTMK
jgi:PAS domain S-box-containing protein